MQNNIIAAKSLQLSRLVWTLCGDKPRRRFLAKGLKNDLCATMGVFYKLLMEMIRKGGILLSWSLPFDD